MEMYSNLDIIRGNGEVLPLKLGQNIIKVMLLVPCNYHVPLNQKPIIIWIHYNWKNTKLFE